ncbi:KRFA protein, partial [Eudromia elegans]|nr:KRFA protein [Eudromia elegans]
CAVTCPVPVASACSQPCVTSCGDSCAVIYPPPVAVTFPGPVLSSCPQQSVVGSSVPLGIGHSLLSQGSFPGSTGQCWSFC